MPVAGSTVLSENGRRRTIPEKSPGPDVDELAGARTGREGRCVIRLEPLARQDLPAVDQLRGGEPHGHAVGSSSASAVVGLGVGGLGVAFDPGGLRRGDLVATAGAIRRTRELGRDRRERLGQRVGEVAEDIGRVVELDQLVGAAERPPLVVGVLGDDLGAEPAGRQRQPLVVVVDDDHVADDRDQGARRRSRTRRAGCASLRWLRSWYSSDEVVQPARRRLVVVLGQRRSAGRPPTSRPPRRTGSSTERDALVRRDAGRPRAGRPRRSARPASRPPRGRPRRRRRRRRPGCTAR